MFLIDVSVPRNIDPEVRHVDNAFLFDIDDLEGHVEQNRDERTREAARAEGIVKEEVGVILKWLQSLEATPAIVALRQRADAIKHAEMQKALSRFGTLTAQQREALDGLASGIVNKLLHGSLVALKSAAQSSNGSVYIEAARRFYGLEPTHVVDEAARVAELQELEADQSETEAPSHKPADESDKQKVARHASGL